MTKHGIGRGFVVGMACAAFSALVGCADLESAEEAPPSQDEAAAGLQQLSGENIKIEGVTASGSGCPAGSWDAQMVPENNAFTLTFNSYSLEAPAQASGTSVQSLACNISIRVRTPRDMSYAVTSFQYYGYANLVDGMKGTLFASYAFTGWGVVPTVRAMEYQFPTPFETTYAVNDDLVARGIPRFWAPCSYTANLQVRTRITAENRNRDRPALLTVDNIDVRSQAALRINYITGRCPPVNPAP